MKKVTLLLIFVLILLLGVLGFNQKNSDLVEYNLEGKKMHLLLADNEIEWERGLMDLRKLSNADGMIFIFPDKKERTFWNKNTLMDLDLYWLDDDKVIGKGFLPSVEKSGRIVLADSPGPVNRVIELVR